MRARAPGGGHAPWGWGRGLPFPVCRAMLQGPWCLGVSGRFFLQAAALLKNQCARRDASVTPMLSGRAFFKCTFVTPVRSPGSCSLSSHWPKWVTWPRPESELAGTKVTGRGEGKARAQSFCHRATRIHPGKRMSPECHWTHFPNCSPRSKQDAARETGLDQLALCKGPQPRPTATCPPEGRQSPVLTTPTALAAFVLHVQGSVCVLTAPFIWCFVYDARPLLRLQAGTVLIVT